MVPSQGGRAQLCVVCAWQQPCSFSDQRVFSCGRSCRRWHLGPGVEGDVPQVRGTSGDAVDGHQARNIRDPSRVLEQGPDRQRAPTGCSGGVSSINGASESRCSHDGSAAWARQGQKHDQHRSSREAMALHEGGFMGQGQAPLAVLAGSQVPAGCAAPAAPVSAHRQRRPWRCSRQRG